MVACATTFSCLLFALCYQLSFAVELDELSFTLGIGRNQFSVQEATKSKFKYMVYSGYAMFDGDTSDLFDDEALFGLAWQAYEEMRHDYGQLQDSCNIVDHVTLRTPMPTIMAAIAIGNEIFFSSQLKGTDAKSFLYVGVKGVDMEKQYNLCQAYLRTEANPRVPNAEPRHNKGICAEILATSMYMKKHDGEPPRTAIHNSSLKARVAVWGYYGDGPKTRSHRVAPCGPVGFSDWGCATFMKSQGITISNVLKFGRGARQEAGWPDLNIPQVRPVEVQNLGVPLTSALDDEGFANEDIDLRRTLSGGASGSF